MTSVAYVSQLPMRACSEGGRQLRDATLAMRVMGSHAIKRRLLSASCVSFLEAFPGAGGGLIVAPSSLGLHKAIKRPCAVRSFRACFPEGASRFPGRPAFQKDRA